MAQPSVEIGQGQINFANFVPSQIDAPFLLNHSVTKVPVAGYEVSLLVGTTASSLFTVDTVGLVSPGYIASKTETLAGIAAGTPIFFAIEIWNTTAGSTFEFAKASGQANAWGQFVSLTASATPSAAPNPPGPLTGLTSVPEPSTFTLAGLGAAAAFLMFRPKK